MAASALGADAAHRVLARAAYGARPGEAEALAREGVATWVAGQLALPAEEPAVEARIAALRLPIRYPAAEGRWPAMEEDRALTRLAMDQAANFRFWPRGDRMVPPPEIDRGRHELLLATLVRRTAAAAQLRERLVEFWHDHFSVSFSAGSHVNVSLVEHDRRLRAHALGSFRTLLEAAATSPAMLFYLNNQSSRAGAPNENFARELLELHTLGRPAYFGAARTSRDVPRDAEGRPAGYVDADVWEAARAFTGWSVAFGQAIDAGRRLPDTGEFAFVEAWHDPYQKQVLGRALDPFAGPMAHGRAVLDLLSEHPATARFLCTKLTRFLVGEPEGGPVPAAPVARGVAAFRAGLAAPDQIARTVAAILAGPEIADPRLGRMRRPADAVVAAARAYDLPLAPGFPLMAQLSGAGQVLFGWPAPDGQPLAASQYEGAGALRARWGMLLGLARGGASPLFEELAGRPAAEVAARLARQALGPGGAPVAATIAGVWAQAGRRERPAPAEVAELAGWVLTAPAFQRA